MPFEFTHFASHCAILLCSQLRQCQARSMCGFIHSCEDEVVRSRTNREVMEVERDRVQRQV